MSEVIVFWRQWSIIVYSRPFANATHFRSEPSTHLSHANCDISLQNSFVYWASVVDAPIWPGVVCLCQSIRFWGVQLRKCGHRAKVVVYPNVYLFVSHTRAHAIGNEGFGNG